ncbi:MAG TPA: family 16 glycoside hydrolase [Bryobacteraceae bacterium]|nr:family 16 glycoside hydrolase [Bryobacteraceae bacterium]
MRAFVWVLLALLIVPPTRAADNAVTRAEALDGWILLFDGDSLFGWTQDKGKWKVVKGVVSLDGADGGMLRTNAVFSDYILKLDFRTPSSDVDGAVFLRIAKDGVPRDTGYDLRLGDSDSKWPGGSMATVFKGNGKLAPNEWHTLEAEVNGEDMTLKIDGRKVGEGKNGKSKAGYIALASSKGPGVEFRNIKLKPIGTALFNGTDLSGWKEAAAAPPPPPKKGGLLKKIDPFKGKPKKPTESNWSVANGAIHGSSGPGQLESEKTYDDFVLQVAVKVNSKQKEKKEPFTAVLLRTDAGKLGTGYHLRTQGDSNTGGIEGLKTARKQLGADDEFVMETIAVRGRHFDIWVNGYPVTEVDDTRPEGTDLTRDAKTAGGPIGLYAPDVEANLDFKSISVDPLPKTIGGKPGAVAAAAPPPPPAPAPPPAPTTTAPAAPAPVIVQQVNPNQAKEDADKKKVSDLETQALTTKDPAQRQQMYAEILKIAPDNQVAAQGYKDAQQQIDQANTQKQKAAEEQQKQSQDEATRAATLASSKQSAENAILQGDLAKAQQQLSIAQKAGPNDPDVLGLKQRVDAAIQSRLRIRYLAIGGTGLLALGAIVLAFLASGKKEPYLEVVEGLDKGKRYKVDQEVIHVGAVAEDGGSKNDIVVHDVERMISRFHCEIHQKNGKLFLIDLNSSNGTYVDKKKAPPGRPVRLKSGSQVALGGSCTLRVGFEKAKKS